MPVEVAAAVATYERSDLCEVAPELRLISCTTADVWQAYRIAAGGSNEARALLEVLCLRETIRKLVSEGRI